jgi:hypothetical protein
VGAAFGAGEAFSAGDAFIAGEGEPLGLAVAPGFRTGVVAEAMSCHCPLRRANVSIERYWPLMSLDLPSGCLYFPPFTVIRRLATAASVSITLTVRSEISHDS